MCFLRKWGAARECPQTTNRRNGLTSRLPLTWRQSFVAVLYVMNKIVLLLQTGAISTRDSFFKMEKDIQDKSNTSSHAVHRWNLLSVTYCYSPAQCLHAVDRCSYNTYQLPRSTSRHYWLPSHHCRHPSLNVFSFLHTQKYCCIGVL